MMSHQVFLRLFILLLCGGLALAQNDLPVTVTGRSYQVNPAMPGQYQDNTARCVLQLENKGSSKLKGVEVEAKFFGSGTEPLFTDKRTVDVNPKSTADVYFLWANPSSVKIDHVEAAVSGKAGQPFQTSVTLKNDY